MNRSRILSLIALFILTIALSSCGQTAENEHLPEYCQTYAGFMSTASADMYELLSEEVGEVTHFNYLSIISEIELTFEKDDPSREYDLDGIQCFQNLTSLTLIGSSFKDISEISALKNIQTIVLEDTSIISISSFKNLSKVKELTISGSKSLQSVDGVEEMTKLTYLELTNNGIVNIKELDSLINLESLILRDNEISYFPEITQLEKLVDLDVSNNNIVELGDDLNGLSNLVTFTASNNQICDLSNLDDLISLEELYLDHNDLGCNGTTPDFTSLFNAPKLRELYLNDNGLTSISDLAGKNLPLEILHIHNNELTDITPISSFTSLQELRLENNQISDIQDLSGMTNLTSIDLQDNLITDFTGLLSIEGLETVLLQRNQITFIPDLNESWPNLLYLYLNDNFITDTSGLKGHSTLFRLDLRHNGLIELDGLSNLPSLKELYLYDDDIDGFFEESEYPDNEIRIIRDSFNNVGLELSDTEDSTRPLVLGFDLAENGEIYGSFIDVAQMYSVDLSDMDIDIIDEFSFSSNGILDINVSGNNLTDISFILNNPNLYSIDISDNPIENLGILSGAATSDLDNLHTILASDIDVPNDLVESFVSLPALVNLDLTNTEFNSITDSFNSLNNLNSLIIDSSTITSISGSFNFLDPEETAYSFSITSGYLGTITNSFNDSVLSEFSITNQNPIISETTITGSFNNLQITGPNGFLINNSDFKVIDDCFNNAVFLNFGIVNSEVTTITNVFDATVVGAKDSQDNNVGGTLSFFNNNIETMDLSLIARVYTLVLSENKLNTVSFIDSIPELEELNLSNQKPDGNVFPLTAIDGINNQPFLTSVNLVGVPIESIDGFKDIGITSFVRDYNTSDQLLYNDFIITSITSDSFSGTDLQTLSLLGHELTDYSFMSNFVNLESLGLSIDSSDFTLFSTIPSIGAIQSLSFESTQPITDFSIFDDFDNATFVSISSPDTVITNLDGLDSVTNLALINGDSITEFNNSFNNMDSLNFTSTYLTIYESLDTITTSFDLDIPSNYDFVVNGDITVTDSLNNVSSILVFNQGETSPLFDTASFDSLTKIEFSDPNYLDYGFLNGYVGLLTIDLNLVVANDVVGLDSSSVTTLLLDPTNISAVNVTLNEAAVIELDGDMSVSVTMNNSDIDFNTSTGTATLYPTANRVNIKGQINNLTIDSTLTTEIGVDQGYYQTMVLNTPNLIEYEKNQGNIALDHETITINATTSNMLLELDANSVVINNDNLATGTVDSSGDLTINNTVTNVSLFVNADQFVLNNNTVTIMSFEAGSNIAEDVILNADSLFLYNGLGSTADEVELNTLVSDLDINSQANTLITVNAPNVSLLDISSNTADIIANTNQTSLQGGFSGTDLTVNNASLQTVTINNETNLTGMLDLDNATSVNNITLGTADIDSVQFTTTDSSITVDGTNVNNYYITGNNVTSITQNSPSSNIFLTGNQATLNLDVTLDTLEVTNTNLTSVTMTNTSSLTTLDLENTQSVATVTTNGGSIGTLDIVTDVETFLINGGNVTNASITSDTITDLTMSLVGDLDFTSTNTGTLNFDVSANNVTLSLDASTINIEDTSTISTLTMSSNNGTNFAMGIAELSNVLITETANGIIQVNGTNIDAITVDGDFTSMISTLTSLTDLSIVSRETATVSILVNTESLTLNALGDVDITNTSLTSLTASTTGGNDIQVLNEGITSFTADVTAGYLIVDNSALTSITIEASSSIDTLELLNTSVETLSLPNTVDNLRVTSSNITSLTYSGTGLGIINLDTPNLATLDSSVNANVFLETNASSVTINGNYNDITMTANTATSMDFDLAVISNDLNITASQIGVLDISNAFATNNDGRLSLDTDEGLIDITYDSATLNVTGPTTSSLTITTTTSKTTPVVFNGQIVSINAVSATVLLTSLGDLNSVNGFVNNMEIDGTIDTTLNLGVTGNSVIIDPGSIDMTTLNAQGSNTLNFLTVGGLGLSTVNTNDNVINNLIVLARHSSLITIDSKAVAVNFDANSNTGKMNLIAYDETETILTNASENTVASTETPSLYLLSTLSDSVSIDVSNAVNLNLEIAAGSPVIDVAISGDLSIDSYTNAGVVLNLSSQNATMIIGGSFLVLDGSVVNRTQIEGFIDNVDTTNFTTSIIDVRGSQIATLGFLSNGLLASLTRVETDNLSIEDVELTYNILNGTNITLLSPLTLTDFEDFFYNDYFTEYTTAEEATDDIYLGLYNEDVDNAVNFLLTSAYYNFMLLADLTEDVETGDYLTSEQQFILYINNTDGTSYTTVAEIIENTTLTQQDVNTAISEIDDILEDQILLINPVAIAIEVNAIIQTNATTDAQTTVSEMTFTLENS